jgi:TolA-binding protein
MAKKDSSGLEIIESAEAFQKTLGKAEGLFENNKKLFAIIGGGIVAIILGYFGYKYYNETQEVEAQAKLFDSVYSFEADSLNQAIKGQGGNPGLLSVADEFGGTKAGKLANLYAGIALMNQSKYKEAAERLEKFSSDDQVVQGKAYCLLGDCFTETGAKEDAIKYYEKAVSFKPNKFSTPGYMMKLALAYSENKNNKSAIEVYSNLIEKYSTSTDAVMAKKYKARLETESGE